MLTKTQKMLVITQLCLAFSLALWVLFDPFMGEHFRIRGDLLLIENIQGNESLISRVDPSYKERLLSHQSLFNSLEETGKNQILLDQQQLLSYIEAPFLDKLARGFYHLLVKTPFFEIAWIFFSIVISILCLKEKEGAKAALFLLPLTVVLYGIDLKDRPLDKISRLYPTEQEISELYLKQPLSSDLQKQKAELLHGFDLFLITKYAQEVPESDYLAFNKQKDKGEFFFNLAQLKERQQLNYSHGATSEHSALLLLYMIWNLGLAAYLNKTGDSTEQRDLPKTEVKDT